MDTLRSPGGCPWDAEQTHTSLAPYLLEEAYETLEAIETGDDDLLREELGDLLLQVLFHARLAEEHDPAWSIDDVAAGLVAKLRRRHPHVFADTTVSGAPEVIANWEQIKKAEKQRTSAIDGVPMGQPALALAATLISRTDRSAVTVEAPDEDTVGARLFALAAQAVGAGLDPEQELRGYARRYVAAVRAAEQDAAEQGAAEQDAADQGATGGGAASLRESSSGRR